MAISTKDFVTLVREQAAAIQGAARSLVDLTVGSILPALIPVGAKVQTANGVQPYAVVKDADHPAWDAEEAGYVLAPNLASITLPVQAEQAGAAGNARIG